MRHKVVSGVLLTLLLSGMLTLAFDIQPVKASRTIYINADGSVDPPTAPISSADNITYTLVDNINDSIVVQRNNIVVDGAGYILQGTGSGKGIDLSYISNVTITNMKIKAFNYGISLVESLNNIISRNNIVMNTDGIELSESSNNRIYHNNFMDNTQQVYIQPYGYSNFWDDGVSEGNYWSDYEDMYPDAEEIDWTSIWDTPYVIDENNQDNYPLVPEFSSFLILPLFMIATLLAVIVYKRKYPMYR